MEHRSQPDPNQHVRDYLDYYVNFKGSPGFAVLLNGKWGTGKTHLVKKMLKALFEDSSDAAKEPDYAYVSLYGISSVQDLDDAMLKAVLPALGSFAGKIGLNIGAGLLKKYLAGDAAEAKNLALDFFKRGLYVFDDLERCDLPIQTALGYINRFVEHHGKRVVIICNEEEVRQEQATVYRRVREKLVGKTLKLETSLDEALPHFISLANGRRTKALLNKRADDLRAIFRESRLENLRILQQSVWDFERMYEPLDPKYDKSDEGIAQFLRLFLATSFEVKAGHLVADDLAKRREAQIVHLMGRKEKEDKPSIVVAAEKYKELVDLTDPLLSDETLISILIKGSIDPSAITNSLDRSVAA